MNAGQYLVSKSPLSSGTALAHLLAMQTGGVRTVFASMFSVQIEEPRLFAVQRPKREAGESAERALPRVDERSNSDVTVLTRTTDLCVLTAPEWLTMTTQRAASVFAQRDVQSAAIHQSDVLGLN